MKQQPIYIRRVEDLLRTNVDVRTAEELDRLGLPKSTRDQFVRYDPAAPRCDTCAKFLRYFEGRGACRVLFTSEGTPYNCTVDDYCSQHEASRQC